MDSIPYVNLHTHQQSSSSNQIEVKNFILGNEEVIIKEDKFCSIGIHPCYIAEEINFDELEKLISKKNCIAIGECGLDKKSNKPDKQIHVFYSQIELAIKYQKPLIIHCVGFHTLLAQILKEKKFILPIILHGFNQKIEVISHFKNLNVYFSLGHALLNRNSNASKILNYCNGKFFLETDNYAISIEEVYKSVVLILNQTEEEIKTHVFNNFLQLFSTNQIATII